MNEQITKEAVWEALSKSYEDSAQSEIFLYCPYIPLMVSGPVVNIENGTMKFMTRYGTVRTDQPWSYV